MELGVKTQSQSVQRTSKGLAAAAVLGVWVGGPTGGGGDVLAC